MIGGAGKWKKGALEKQIVGNEYQLILKARLVERLSDNYVVEFSWTPADLSFSEVLEVTGDIPLPPYIKRDTHPSDRDRYQTIFAKLDGSVAAPTAGLHFTERLFQNLEEKHCSKDFVTLHVGAGTFKPVKAEKMGHHVMHAEWIDVKIQTIENIMAHLNKIIVAVGTTSIRTVESLYWLGVKCLLDPSVEELKISQWEVYDDPFKHSTVTAKDALASLLHWLQRNNYTRLFTSTQILIAPGYLFRIVNALVTNFHQPNSTLLLLVAAIVGKDWKTIYDYALENNFRFLSYGDGSLLFI